MSANDWHEYGSLARRLIGKPLQLGLPTNSLKLMADPESHQDGYIWIDPPWELLQHDIPVVGAEDYPDPGDADYLERHTSWGSRVRPLLDGAVLANVAVLPNGATEFGFDTGVILRVVGTLAEPDDSRGYDDWYAKG